MYYNCLLHNISLFYPFFHLSCLELIQVVFIITFITGMKHLVHIYRIHFGFIKYIVDDLELHQSMSDLMVDFFIRFL